jgi:inosine-uridine nucleoside N-ribohydrolase
MERIVYYRGIPQVLLFTDIGYNIDDALALFTLAPFTRSEEVVLAGVVTCGKDALTSACNARGWLRKLGFHDKDVPVAFGRSKGTRESPLPLQKGFPTPSAAALYSQTETGATTLILNLCKRHQRGLRVVVLSPMTALADAVEGRYPAPAECDTFVTVQGIPRLLSITLL